jgi:hypothetical protein
LKKKLACDGAARSTDIGIWWGDAGLNPFVAAGDPVVDHWVLQIVTLANRIGAAAVTFIQKPRVVSGIVFSIGSTSNGPERPVPEKATSTSRKKFELVHPVAEGRAGLGGAAARAATAETADGAEAGEPVEGGVIGDFKIGAAEAEGVEAATGAPGAAAWPTGTAAPRNDAITRTSAAVTRGVRSVIG